jgi:hypothetical protein
MYWPCPTPPYHFSVSSLTHSFLLTGVPMTLIHSSCIHSFMYILYSTYVHITTSFLQDYRKSKRQLNSGFCSGIFLGRLMPAAFAQSTMGQSTCHRSASPACHMTRSSKKSANYCTVNTSAVRQITKKKHMTCKIIFLAVNKP